MIERLRKSRRIPAVLIVCVAWLSILPAAQAGLISTTELVAAQQLVVDQQTLLSALERTDVRQALIAQGVDPKQAKARVASMTAEEVQLVNEKLNQLPAGSGLLETAVFVFLLLLVTDMLGLTDIFPFVVKQR